MNKLEDGKVVFFCGAGISSGSGSDLPGFRDLVKYVYTENRMEPDPVEREALAMDPKFEKEPSDTGPKFDKVPELLEREDMLVHIHMRLNPPRPGELVRNGMDEGDRDMAGTAVRVCLSRAQQGLSRAPRDAGKTG